MFTQLTGQCSGRKWTKVTYAACVFCSHYSNVAVVLHQSTVNHYKDESVKQVNECVEIKFAFSVHKMPA